MKTYSDELKASLIERMLPPQEANVSELSRESGVPKDTLYCWRAQARRQRGVLPSSPTGSAERWSSEEKFAVVLETAPLNEAQVGQYCRKRGLYPEQLRDWRRACEQANGGRGSAAKRAGADAQADRRRIRELEQELNRKDKALAETAALLVLRKKAQAIWGEGEAV